MLSIRYPMEVPLVGDAAATLRALLPLLDGREDHTWREGIERSVESWREVLADRAQQPASPINPQRVFTELSARLPDGAIITSDSGSAANWYARDIDMRRGMMGSLSGSLASMGAGVPYAIAAKFAHPDRPVIALVGDGAMQMNGMAELITIAKYQHRWDDKRLVVMVLNNRDLNQVTWEQRVMQGDPRYDTSQDVPDFPYARFAEMAGLKGIRVEDPDMIGAAWDEALAATVPAVIEVITDPEVPPLPPHITLEQARNFTESVLRGDAHRGRMLRESLRQMAGHLLPNR
jgi:pyruvate dehydrogenase (quinone)